MNKHFSEQETQMANKHIKRCSKKKEMFNLVSSQGNAKLNHNEITFHTHQTDKNEKVRYYKSCPGCEVKGILTCCKV